MAPPDPQAVSDRQRFVDAGLIRVSLSLIIYPFTFTSTYHQFTHSPIFPSPHLTFHLLHFYSLLSTFFPPTTSNFSVNFRAHHQIPQSRGRYIGTASSSTSKIYTRMPPIRSARNRKPPPDGFDDLEDTLLEFSNKMKDAENSSHEGKKRQEVLWPIFQITHQRKSFFL